MDFAKHMGKSKGVVTQWLNGTVKSLKAETAQRMQEVTGHRSEWLISGKGPRLVSETVTAITAHQSGQPTGVGPVASHPPSGAHTPADHLRALVDVFASAPESTSDMDAMLSTLAKATGKPMLPVPVAP